MASEPWYNRPDTFGKPPADASNGGSQHGTGGSAARGALKVASIAGKGIARGAHAVSDFAANNSWGLRLFSFICSIGLFVLAILGLVGTIGETEDGHPASFYLFNAYMLILAILIFVAECKDEWVGFKSLRPWVLEQFGFLQSNLGRGVYLFFIGIIWFGAWGWFWGIAGFVVMGVGALYVAMHWRGAGTPASNATQSGTARHVPLSEEADDLP